jgi:hypothetical protein
MPIRIWLTASHCRTVQNTSARRITARCLSSASVGDHDVISEVSDTLNNKLIDKYRSFSPEVSEKLTTLLNGMVSSTVEDLGNTDSKVRAIRLGNEARLSDYFAGDTIYERPFYSQLVSAIRRAHRKVLLISNPGTGKSAFQYYLLARYLNPSQYTDSELSGPVKFGHVIPPKVVIRHIPSGLSEVWFLEKRVVHIIERCNSSLIRCFNETTTQYFFEPGVSKDISPLDEPISTLATTSPHLPRYEEFAKRAAKLYMPVFTKEELLAIGRDMRTRSDFDQSMSDVYSDAEIKRRFAKHNGIIRHVLPTHILAINDAAKEYEKALHKIDPSKFRYEQVESGGISHYLAFYSIPCDNGIWDFTTFSTSPMNPEVLTRVEAALRRDRI